MTRICLNGCSLQWTFSKSYLKIAFVKSGFRAGSLMTLLRQKNGLLSGHVSSEDPSPWTQQARISDAIAKPGMISEEEGQYYEYIGGFYRGHGEAIELGPWLGKSTRHIIRGLDRKSGVSWQAASCFR